jgi:ABC-type uncharacterized transport system involved in gliding motility auxiliary subunit
MATKTTPGQARRKLLLGSGSAAAVVIVLAILVVLALLGERYSWRWDLTGDRSQSLSKITQNILAAVKEPLTMTAFLPEGQADRQQAKELLHNFHLQNRLITVQIVDPERHPAEAQQAGYRLPGNILLEYQGRRQMASSPTEENIVEAIRKLLNPKAKIVYFLTGHGERGAKETDQGSFSQARQALVNEGYEVQDLNLLTQPQVPGEAVVVILAGPEKPLFPNEIKALQDYLNRGGRVLVLLEPHKDAGLKDFLGGFGIVLDDRLILDDNQVSRALGASLTMPLVIQYGSHRITQELSNLVTIFPMARPLFLAKEVPNDIRLTPLAMTTKTSWAKAGQEWLKQGKADFTPDQDLKGPFTLAVLAEKSLQRPAATPAGPNNQAAGAAEGQAASAPAPQEPSAGDRPDQTGGTEAAPAAYLAVFGNVHFADNNYFNLSANGDFFLNTVNFLADVGSQITLRSTARKSQPLLLTGYQGWGMLLVCLVFIPLAIILGGVSAYLRRRARR